MRRLVDFVFEMIAWSMDHQFDDPLPGDRFTPHQPNCDPDFEVLDISARADPNDPQNPLLVHRLRVPLDSDALQVIDGNKVSVRLHTGARLEGDILAETRWYRDVEAIDATKGFRKWRMAECHEVTKLWDLCQHCKAGRGLFCESGLIPDDLKTSLLNGIDQMAQAELPDYHPNTRQVVRDHVHPSLYPYIKGVSRVTGQVVEGGQGTHANDGWDAWGRKYENSIYQWLPAQFFVDSEGKCSIQSYINNLPQDGYPQLYADLELLFDIFLPWFERACRRIDTLTSNHDLGDLRNRELQVVVKIVDYEFVPGASFEGVWHVEGMSHENIVATGLCVLERTECVKGGDLLFKRPFDSLDISQLEQDMPPSRHSKVDEIIDEGLVPCGKFHTREGALIVFPNSHVHKVDLMYNDGVDFGRRRIIVFFLVNPLVSIISTRDVPPQQGYISRQDAMEHRLRLMEERKRHKQTWNVRKVELCEH